MPNQPDFTPALWPLTAELRPDGHLAIGGCDLPALAQEFGTPLYVLDEATFHAQCRAYRAALARHYPGEHQVHYAGKALLNTGVAQLAHSEGLGLDVVSGGELAVALRSGVPPAHIHLHGNAKPRAELQAALATGIGKIMIDSLDELDLLASLTAGRSTQQAVMLRLTPDIAADTHTHIETGRASSKFGFPLEALDEAATRLLAAPGLRLVGLHAHIGSQIFERGPFEQALGVLLDCAAQLRARGLAISEISPGGGLGVPYTAAQTAPDLDAYVAAISDVLVRGCAARGLPLPRLILEPGRSIVARAGVALYTVVATKAAPGLPRFLHLDGGMADNIRPALYGARYTALLANRATELAGERVHVAGRYCESGDILLRDVDLPAAGPGDLLALAVAGAYTLSMASNYNLVPRPALLLLANGHARVLQRRETYDDLVARDAFL